MTEPTVTPPAPAATPARPPLPPAASAPAPTRAHKPVSLLPWFLVLGSAALCFLFFHSFARLAKTYFGPQSVAAGFETVWVYNQARLWRLKPDGTVLARYDGGANGLGKVIDTLIALGPYRVALHDFDARAWRECRAGESGVALDCGELLPAEFRQHAAAESAIALAPDGRRWVFADFDAGELLLFDADKTLLARGKGLASRDGGTVLWLGPQEIGLIGSDRATLYALEVGPRSLGLVQPRWDLTENEAPAKGYLWHAAYNPERRAWYLARSVSRGARHTLWRVDREGRRSADISLGARGEPAQVVPLDRDSVLVADVVRGRVHQLSWENDRVREFGDPSFRESLARTKGRHSLYETLQQVAFVLLFVVPIGLGAFFAIREARRDAAELAQAVTLPPLDPETEFWFTPDEKQFALRERMLVLLGACLALVVYFEFRALAQILKLDPRFVATLSTLLILGAIAGTAWLWWRQHQRGPRGLGRRGGEVLFDRGLGEAESHNLDTVLTDGRRMLLGRELLPLRSEGLGLRAEWNVSELFSYIVKELPASAYRSTQHLHWLFLRRNPVLLGLAVLPLILLLSILLLAAAFGLK